MTQFTSRMFSLRLSEWSVKPQQASAFPLQTDKITEQSGDKIKTKLSLYSANSSVKKKLKDILEGLNDLTNKATQVPSEYLLENCNNHVLMKKPTGNCHVIVTK
jgi:hypothetical protein